MSRKSKKSYALTTERFRKAYLCDRIPAGKLRHDVKAKFCDVFGITPTTFKLKLSAVDGERTPFTALHCKWMEEVDPLVISQEANVQAH